MSTPTHLTILVVDEDSPERSLVRHLAEGIGWTVEEAASIREMTDWLRGRPSGALGCVVVSYPLSDGDGFDAVAACKAIRMDYPLLLLVEDNDADVVLKLLNSGAAGYVEKSALSESRLAQAIRRAMRGRGVNTLGEHALIVAAFQQSAAAILVTDSFGNVLLHNERWVELLGQTLGTLDNVSEMLERARATVPLASSDRADLLQAVVDSQSQSAEFCLHLDNRQTTTVRLTKTPILDQAGQPIGSVAFLDAADWMQQTRVLQRTCHDLRNPLSAIMINANILARDGAVSNERRIKVVTRMLSSATRMNRMIEDLFDYAMAAQGKDLPVHLHDADLNAIVNDALADLRSEFPGRSLVFEANGDLRGRWDPARLRQMLNNLVGIALKRGSTRASLRIVCSELADPPSVEIRLDITHDSLNIDLATLAQETTPPEHTFEPGLFVAERIVAAHQGMLNVIGETREATSFLVRLPKPPALAVDEQSSVPLCEQQV